MSKIQNPFLLYGYVSPAYFCDREVETGELVSALRNGRNVTLMSPRRMGKTGLIHHVFHRLKQEDDSVTCFYMDVFSTKSLKDFVEVFGRTIVGQLDTPAQKAAGFIAQFFQSAKVVLSVDAMTGAPQASLDFRPSETNNTLQEIFAYLRQSDRECYIAIDEFQQILEYPDEGVEALLRSYIQFCPNVHFIFSGSKQHLMVDIFSSSNRPFYQSTQKMTLGPIPKDAYYAFAAQWMEQTGINLAYGIFEDLYHRFEGHTWYVHYLLNNLYALHQPCVTNDDVKACLLQIIRQETDSFQHVYDKLTFNQAMLLQAIAKEGVVPAINSGSFIRKYDLKGSSSVNKSLGYLLDKELVYRSSNGYMVYNRYFGIWLSNL